MNQSQSRAPSESGAAVAITYTCAYAAAVASFMWLAVGEGFDVGHVVIAAQVGCALVMIPTALWATRHHSNAASHGTQTSDAPQTFDA
ncbi:MAG: hypothetical protein AAB263_11875, partial [Planctomycetota bacterium]